MRSDIAITYYHKGLLVVQDLDIGNMSVTNDADAVFATLDKLFVLGLFNTAPTGQPPVHVKGLVYRDSMGVYDMLYKEGDAVGFFRLGYTDLNDVIAAIQPLTIL